MILSVGKVIGMIMSDNMITFLILIFQIQLETAKRRGDRDVFDKMERQLAWLHEQRLNKYRR